MTNLTKENKMTNYIDFARSNCNLEFYEMYAKLEIIAEQYGIELDIEMSDDHFNLCHHEHYLLNDPKTFLSEIDSEYKVLRSNIDKIKNIRKNLEEASQHCEKAIQSLIDAIQLIEGHTDHSILAKNIYDNLNQMVEWEGNPYGGRCNADEEPFRVNDWVARLNGNGGFSDYYPLEEIEQFEKDLEEQFKPINELIKLVKEALC
jgi:hypothetical protein